MEDQKDILNDLERLMSIGTDIESFNIHYDGDPENITENEICNMVLGVHMDHGHRFNLGYCQVIPDEALDVDDSNIQFVIPPQVLIDIPHGKDLINSFIEHTAKKYNTPWVCVVMESWMVERSLDEGIDDIRSLNDEKHEHERVEVVMVLLSRKDDDNIVKVYGVKRDDNENIIDYTELNMPGEISGKFLYEL